MSKKAIFTLFTGSLPSFSFFHFCLSWLFQKAPLTVIISCILEINIDPRKIFYTEVQNEYQTYRVRPGRDASKQRKSCIAKDQGRAGEGRREGCASREVYDFQEERLLHEANLDRASALELMKYMDTLPAIYGWYQGGQGFISSLYYERMEEFAHAPWLFDSMKRAYTPTGNPKKTLLEEKSGPQKLQLYFRDLEARKKALLEIPRLFPQCAVSSSLPINIEINATDATKGHALAFLTKHLGLKTEETLAFGDGTNDITMIRQAGTGVAMGNAAPEVLAAADRVTASNDEDGLAKILEELSF